METISAKEIRIGLQYLEIPEGETLYNEKPFLSENVHSEEEDTLYYYHLSDGTWLCRRINVSWGTSYFGFGETLEEAFVDTNISKEKAGSVHYGVYFENEDRSWMIRELMKIDLPRPEPIPNLSNFKKFKISNVENGYATGEGDRKIFYLGKNSMYVFEFSGDETYPLGKLVWGQRWIPESAQYLGGGNHVFAEACLTWRLNQESLSEALR